MQVITAPVKIKIRGLDSGYVLNFIRWKKFFELSNHLGNVIATIADHKVGVQSGGIVSYYLSVVVSAQDYAPFGSAFIGRQFSVGNQYRYGFNGKEKDNDIEDNGRDYEYGFRIYDSRIGKFLSVDPLIKKYPWYTPYQFAGNKPIWATNLDGLEENTTSTYVKKPVMPLPRKPTFQGIITIVDATTQSINKTFDGNYTELQKFDKPGLAPAVVDELTKLDNGTKASRLSITMTGMRSQASKSWKGTGMNYFTRYSYSFIHNNVTEVGTFELMTGSTHASARAWDPIAMLLINKAVSSLVEEAVVTPWGKAIQSTAGKVLEASKRVFNGTTLELVQWEGAQLGQTHNFGL